MIGALLPIAGYVVACNLPPAWASYIPAATFSMFVLAIKTGLSTWFGFAVAFIPAAVALQLYTTKYSGSSKIGLMANPNTPQQPSPISETAPRMVVEYLYMPSIGAITTLAATTLASNAGFGFAATSGVAAYGIVLAHCARSISFAVQRMIYPAPIVAQFLIGEKALQTYKAPIAKYCKKTNVFKTLGDENSAVLGTVEYAVIPRPSLGRNLSSGTEVLEKQWIVYFGGNGEVFEASVPSPLQLAAELKANLLVLNPRGVGASSGTSFNANDLILDARTVVRKVIQEYNLPADGRNFLVIGHSIGGGVAAALATTELPQASVVFDRTFSTLSDACVALSPIKHEGLVRSVIPYIFGEFDIIGQYKKIAHSRKLVIYHKEDQIIHYNTVAMGRLGASGLGGEKYVLELQGRSQDNHNSGFDKFTNYRDVVARIRNIL